MAHTTPTATRKPITILVVENHDEVRNLMGNVVASQGWRAIKASGVREGITCLRTQPVDAIIADWELDDGDSAPILREAQRVRPAAAIPVVVISSYASPALREQVRAFGALELFEKPFRIEQMVDLLNHSLLWPEPAVAP